MSTASLVQKYCSPQKKEDSLAAKAVNIKSLRWYVIDAFGAKGYGLMAGSDLSACVVKRIAKVVMDCAT